MAPPYEPFWGFPLLDQLVVGIVFWTLVWLGHRFLNWLWVTRHEEPWDYEEHHRKEVAAFMADYLERKEAWRRASWDAEINRQFRTGIGHEDLPEPQFYSSKDPGVIITFPIKPKAQTNEDKEEK